MALDVTGRPCIRYSVSGSTVRCQVLEGYKPISLGIECLVSCQNVELWQVRCKQGAALMHLDEEEYRDGDV